jgi:uncharacterized membrane protein YdfJ with MMPL/SSD domain
LPRPAIGIGNHRPGARIEAGVNEQVARAIVTAAGAYVAAGLLFAAAFVTRGVSRVDPVARGSGVGFRLIIVPGVVALWPLLFVRWAVGSMHPPTEVNAHRRAARRAS